MEGIKITRVASGNFLMWSLNKKVNLRLKVNDNTQYFSTSINKSFNYMAGKTQNLSAKFSVLGEFKCN